MPTYPLAVPVPFPGDGTGTTGWTVTLGQLTERTSDPAPKVGAGYFMGGASSKMVAHRDVALAAETVTDIDAGLVAVEAGAWQSGWSTQRDNALIRVYALSATGTVLADAATTPFYSNHTFTWRAVSLPLPTGTRSLRVEIESVRTDGTNNDGYHNGIALTLNGPAVSLSGRTRFGNLFVLTRRYPPPTT
jgi:hypothetical protein